MRNVPVVADTEGPYVPAFPVWLGNDDINPFQYAEPVLTDWTSPSPVGYGGAPSDDFPGLADNPDIPGPWNRTTQQQDPGVAYNHNSRQASQTSGTGSMKMITEPENNMGGTITTFPFSRYASRPDYEDNGDMNYVVWSEPLPSDGRQPGLLAQYVLPVVG